MLYGYRQIGGGHSMENYGLNITGDLELLDSQNDGENLGHIPKYFFKNILA